MTTTLIAIAAGGVVLLAALPTKKGKKTVAGDFSLYRYSIELIYLDKLKRTKWWQVYKRKQIHRWRKEKLRELDEL